VFCRTEMRCFDPALVHIYVCLLSTFWRGGCCHRPGAHRPGRGAAGAAHVHGGAGTLSPRFCGQAGLLNDFR
jgi:hypothetical protein